MAPGVDITILTYLFFVSRQHPTLILAIIVTQAALEVCEDRVILCREGATVPPPV